MVNRLVHTRVMDLNHHAAAIGISPNILTLAASEPLFWHAFKELSRRIITLNAVKCFDHICYCMVDDTAKTK